MFVLNLILYFMFLSNTPMYQAMKATGQYPCYGQIVMDGNAPDGPPPVCFYDPKAY